MGFTGQTGDRGDPGATGASGATGQTAVFFYYCNFNFTNCDLVCNAQNHFCVLELSQILFGVTN